VVVAAIPQGGLRESAGNPVLGLFDKTGTAIDKIDNGLARDVRSEVRKSNKQETR